VTKEKNDGQLCTNPSVAAQKRNNFIKQPCNPFKVQVNFDIPLFEGLVYVDDVDKWLNMLKGYFLVRKFFDRENITFSFLKVAPHVKD
jgi:hypothetical protein